MADVLDHPNKIRSGNPHEESFTFTDGSILKLVSGNSRRIGVTQQLFMLEFAKLDLMLEVRGNN